MVWKQMFSEERISASAAGSGQAVAEAKPKACTTSRYMN